MQYMETKAVEKPRASWPTLFDGGWMEKFFNAPIDEFFNMGKVMNVPAVNVAESDKEYKLTVAAPGMSKSDFKVEADDNMLTISAEKKEEKEEKNDRFNRREYNYNSWSRSFTLPENCNGANINAVYENGELRVLIPKREVKEAKKIKSIAVS